MKNNIYFYILSIFILSGSLFAEDNKEHLIIEEYSPVVGQVSVVFIAKVEHHVDGKYMLGKMHNRLVERWKNLSDGGAETALFYIDKENKSFVWKKTYSNSKSSSGLERDLGVMNCDSVKELSLKDILSKELSLSSQLVKNVTIKLLFIEGDDESEFVYINLSDSDLEKLKNAYPVFGFAPWYDDDL